MIRTLLRGLGALCAAAILASCSQVEEPAAMAPSAPGMQPNILLVIADDIGVDMTTQMYPGLIEHLQAQYGPDGFDNPDWRKIDGHPTSTPVLNAFARQSMRFTANWANPFCSPTRASLLTGLNTAQTHVATYADALDQSYDSFVTQLGKAGYATGVFGKWHMAGLEGRGQAPDYPGMKPAEAGSTGSAETCPPRCRLTGCGRSTSRMARCRPASGAPSSRWRARCPASRRPPMPRWSRWPRRSTGCASVTGSIPSGRGSAGWPSISATPPPMPIPRR